jgi:hypothetical protein
MDYFLIILYTIILLFIIGKWRLFKFDGINPRWFQVVLLVKICAGVGLYLIYTKYYTVRADADIFKYFDDSTVLYNSFWESPGDFFQMLFSIDCEGEHFRNTYYTNMFTWFKSFDSDIFNNNRTMVRINAVIRFFSNGSYHIHALFMSFISMVGITLIMKAFRNTISKFKGLSVLLIFLLPSTLMWTSGILKGAILFLWLGLLIYSYSRLKIRFHWMYLILVPVSIYFIYTTKYYILIAGAPVAIGAFIGLFYKKHSLIRYGLGISICLAAFLIISPINFSYNPTGLIMSKHNDMVQKSLSSNAKSSFDIKLYDLEDPESSAMLLLKNSPKAFYHTFFEPTPSHTSNPMALLTFLENIFILLFLLTAIILIRKPTNWPMVIGLIVFIIGLYVILGWTTPNAGAVARYKVPALPLIIILGLEMMSNQKSISKIKFLNKHF